MKEIKHYLASANTGAGFINYFKNINDAACDSFKYVIKGAPGTGKSSLMKKIGKHFFECGKEIEYFHCSSDESSIDAIRLVKENISIVDGTAPHLDDVDMCSINSKIINVGQFIDDSIFFEKEDIGKLFNDKNKCQKYAKDFIKCAGILFSQNIDILKQENNQKIIDEKTQKLIKKLSLKKVNNKNYKRHLFLSYSGKTGIDNLITKNNFQNKITLYVDTYLAGEIFKNVFEYCSNLGYKIIAFLSILNPQLIESLYIPDIDIFIANDCNNLQYTPQILSNNILINSLMADAGHQLTLAKDYHQVIEKYYIDKMDFKALDNLTENLIVEIESRIEMQLRCSPLNCF